MENQKHKNVVRLNMYGKDGIQSLDFEAEGLTNGHMELVIKGMFSAMGVPKDALTVEPRTPRIQVEGTDEAPKVVKTVESTPVNLAPVRAKSVSKPTPDPVSKSVTQSTEESVFRPRKLPLLGSSNTQVSLVDALSPETLAALSKAGISQSDAEDMDPKELNEAVEYATGKSLTQQSGIKPTTPTAEPEFYKTGIKFRDDLPLYRTHYVCPDNHKGRHYVPFGTTEVNCRECGVPLVVEPANPVRGFGTSEAHRDEWGNFFKATQVSDNKA